MYKIEIKIIDNKELFKVLMLLNENFIAHELSQT